MFGENAVSYYERQTSNSELLSRLTRCTLPRTLSSSVLSLCMVHG